MLTVEIYGEIGDTIFTDGLKVLADLFLINDTKDQTANK